MINNRDNTEQSVQEPVQDITQESTQEQTQQQFKNVFVLTNTTDNQIKSLYVTSLATTIRLALFNGIKVFPIFSGKIDSSTMAKNELLNNLKDTEYDSVVFINDDLAWDPVSFVSCVLSKEDVVALPVVKKTLGNVVFDLDMDTTDIEKNDEGLIKVKHASTGFLKVSNKVMTELMDSSVSVTNNTGNEVKNVFEFQVKDGQFFNDSIVLCHKIKDMGYDIWLNPQTTCAQLTDNLYAVDFATALDSNLNPQVPNTDTVTPTEGSTGATDTPKDDGIKSLYE
jgi:hypothetical protein